MHELIPKGLESEERLSGYYVRVCSLSLSLQWGREDLHEAEAYLKFIQLI